MAKKNNGKAASGRKIPAPAVPVVGPGAWEREIEHWFDDFRRRFALPALGRDEAWWPFAARNADLVALDMFDRDGDVVVRADLPGVARDDVEVTLTGNRLTIRAHKRKDDEVRDEHVYRRERHWGEVVRSVAVPEGVDPERIVASFKDGVLEICLPRIAGARPAARKVRID